MRGFRTVGGGPIGLNRFRNDLARLVPANQHDVAVAVHHPALAAGCILVPPAGGAQRIGAAKHGERYLAAFQPLHKGQRRIDAAKARFHIIHEAEASLKRLGRDHLDLYFLHEWDGMTPVAEIMEALDTLVKQGKVRYVGCSNFSGWHIMKCMMAADRHNFQKFVVQQIHYTIEAREAEYELMPIAVDQGVGIQIWSPIAGGLLSGKFTRTQKPDISRHLSGWSEPPIRDEGRLYRIIDTLLEVGKVHGVSAAQVALAWLGTRPGVASIIVGARNEVQLKDNLAAASLKLTSEDLKKLDDVSALPLIYPYWHQFNSASERLGASDLALYASHIAKRAAG